MKAFKRFTVLFAFLFLIWIALTSWDREELIVGFLVSLLLTFLFYKRAYVYNGFKLNPKAIIYAIIYVFVFIIAVIKSNLDVAKRVISPKLPINPGIVKVKTNLKSPIGRILLANSITLTPGTLTVETKGEYFYIHWIDVTAPDIEGATKDIVIGFEKYLEVICG